MCTLVFLKLCYPAIHSKHSPSLNLIFYNAMSLSVPVHEHNTHNTMLKFYFTVDATRVNQLGFFQVPHLDALTSKQETGTKLSRSLAKAFLMSSLKYSWYSELVLSTRHPDCPFPFNFFPPSFVSTLLSDRIFKMPFLHCWPYLIYLLSPQSLWGHYALGNVRPRKRAAVILM